MARDFEYSDPQLDAQNEAMRDAFENKSAAAELLSDSGFHKDAAAMRLKAIAELRDRAYTLTRTMGLQAIAEGTMTQTEMAEIMGIHAATVGAWVRDAREHPEPHDYVKEPLNGSGLYYRSQPR